MNDKSRMQRLRAVFRSRKRGKRDRRDVPSSGRSERTDALQKLEAVDLRHADIADQHVRSLALQSCQRFVGRAGREHRGPAIVEDALDEIAAIRFVVDYQDPDSR